MLVGERVSLVEVGQEGEEDYSEGFVFLVGGVVEGLLVLPAFFEASYGVALKDAELGCDNIAGQQLPLPFE